LIETIEHARQLPCGRVVHHVEGRMKCLHQLALDLAPHGVDLARARARLGGGIVERIARRLAIAVTTGLLVARVLCRQLLEEPARKQLRRFARPGRWRCVCGLGHRRRRRHRRYRLPCEGHGASDARARCNLIRWAPHLPVRRTPHTLVGRARWWRRHAPRQRPVEIDDARRRRSHRRWQRHQLQQRCSQHMQRERREERSRPMPHTLSDACGCHTVGWVPHVELYWRPLSIRRISFSPPKRISFSPPEASPTFGELIAQLRAEQQRSVVQ
jgi:hypothetical protein